MATASRCHKSIRWYRCTLATGHDGEHRAEDEAGRPWCWYPDSHWLEKMR